MFHIEDYLEKVTPRQFFTTIAILIGIGLLTAAFLIVLMIGMNFNFLNWME